MKTYIDRVKNFSRRLYLISLIKCTLTFTILARLFYLQLIKYRKYKTLSDSNRIKAYVIAPLRGKIYDRDNIILAGNTTYYRVLLDPSIKQNTDKILKNLEITGELYISSINNIKFPKAKLYD